VAFLNKILKWMRFFSPKHSEKWMKKELPEIVGRSRDVVIRCCPFPLKEKKKIERRKYLYSDFGSDFRHELIDVQLSDWTMIKQDFDKRNKKTVTVKLPKCKNITVSIECNRLPSRQQFFSDIADALIDALKKNKIQP